MRSSHLFLSRILVCISIVSLFPLGVSAVTYPVSPPAGEQAGGWFQTYFDNMYTTPCGVNQFLSGFSLSGTLLCSTPGLYITGLLGQTLYYDGTNWVASSNIWNNNTNVGIGTSTPSAKLDINGDILVNSLTLGRGSGSISSNAVFGYQTLYSNITGINNVGLGYETLYANSSGFGNSAAGYRALRNTTGNNNTGFGFESLFNNITGSNNTAYGVNSLYLSTIGTNNTALGYGALGGLTSGNNNIAIGYNADVLDSSGSGQLSIGNWIYGSGGKIGIGTGALNTQAILKLAGQIEIVGGSPGVGKVLTSDANGLASWTGLITATSLNITGSSLGSTIYYDGTNWVTSTNIYNAGGNVGIGAPAPGAKLEVNGQVKITGGSVSSGRVLTTDATGLASWQDPGVASTVPASGVISGVQGYIPFFGTGGNGLYSSLLFQTGGRIGIGTSSPAAELDIVGSIKISGGSPGVGKILTSDATGLATWGNPSIASLVYATGVIADYGSGGYITRFMPFGSGITSSIMYQSGSFIGIGNTNPVYGLDITGTFRTVSNAVIGGTIQIAGGSPGTGKVLMSDATGLASWGNPTLASNVYATGVLGGAGSGGYLTKFMTAGSGITSALVFESGSFIGIGNTNPGYSLDISGTLRTTSATLLQNTLTVGGATSLQGTLSVTGNTLIGGTVQISGGSPGLGKVLTSNASGLASWSSGTVTIDNIFGGTQGYITRFATGGTGIMNSSLFETGGRIAIGTVNPSATFQVTGSGLFSGDVTVQGKLITDTIVNRTVANVSISGSILPDTAAPLTYRDIGNDTTGSWNNLYLSGQIKIKGGSPGLGKILMSDASGLATWTTYVSGSTATGITGGASGYLSIFGTGGNGLYSSLLFQTGSFIGIGNINPLYKLDVAGTFRATGATSLASTLDVNGATNLTSTLAVNGTTTLRNTLTVTGATSLQSTLSVTGNTILGGTIQIQGGSPALGRFLVSDASGNATWTGVVTATSLAFSGSVVGSTLYYNGSAWTSGTGLFNSGGNIGIGTVAPNAKLTISSGLSGTSGLRFGNLTSTAAVVSTNVIGLGVDGSGNVVPISNGDVIVYDGLSTSIPSPNPDVANREISYDFNKFFDIPARQSFVVSDGTNPGTNAPYLDENAASSICEWSGTYGTGMSTCPTSDSPGSPYNSFTMSARGNGGIGYQLGLAYRGDAPLFARSGYFRGGYGSGLYLGSTSSTPAPWFKVFTVPANHLEYFYIDTGYTGRFAATGKAGNIGVGTTSPDSRFEIWTGATTTVLMHFRGSENVGLGLGALNTAVSGNRNIGIGSSALSANTSGSNNIGIGYRAGNIVTTGSNNISIGSGSNVVSGTASNQLSIGNWIYGSGGKIGIGTGSLNTNAILKVAGQIEITGGTPGIGRFLVSDTNGLASWTGLVTATSLSIAGAITGSTLYYNGSAWTSGTGLYNTGGNIGINTTSPTAKLTIDSGVANTSGLRLVQTTSSSANFTGAALGLGIDGSGNVVPIPKGNIAVYTAKSSQTTQDTVNFLLPLSYNQYFIPGQQQTFTTTDVSGLPAYAPNLANGTDPNSICNGTGTGVSVGCVGTPWANFASSAYNINPGGTSYAYQLVMSDRVDSPLFFRGGRLRSTTGSILCSSTTNCNLTGGIWNGNGSRMANWFSVLTVPANHAEFLYVNPGVDANNNPISGGGNVGIGTISATSKFEIWSGSTSYMHYRGTGNLGIGIDAVNTALTGIRNVGIGYSALDAVTSGSYNVAIGPGAGSNQTSGTGNIMIGSGALVFSSTGSSQLSIGNWIYGTGGFVAIGNSNPTSQFEVWSGANSMAHFRGTDNVGFGLNAARYQASGTANSAFGDDALRTATTGYSNTALGNQSLYSNQTGFFNTAGGTQSLYTNSDGTWNVGLGSQALYTNLSGDYNVAIGGQSLYLNSSGNDSVAIGYLALRGTTAGFNIGIGSEAGSGITTGTGNIMIGYRVQANSNSSSNQLNIGNWIYGSGGNIGIGIANPATKLDVNGQIKITGGSPGVGKVLTSDASGLASWQTPSGGGGGGSGWSLTGDSGTTPGTNFIGTTDNQDFLIYTNNTRRITVGSGGNIGIGTNAPASKLEVNGTFDLGANGTQLNAIIKATVNKDLPNIGATSCSPETFTVTNAQTTGSVVISPATALNNRLFIAYARVSATNTVEAKFCNETAAGINMPAMDFYITVIQ